jgi:hypothetical protein
VKWREQGGDPAALKFRWDVFTLAGEDKGFGSPDGLWFDPRGVLWIQTDVSTSTLNRGPYSKLGNNQMLAADVTTGEIRRFLTGPTGCEITGVTVAPDGRSLFVNIQHPGEPASERSDPASPRHLQLARFPPRWPPPRCNIGDQARERRRDWHVKNLMRKNNRNEVSRGRPTFFYL